MPKQDLKDILGGAGDFQFSFAIKDLITPAIESIDRATHSLMKFFEEQRKELAKDFKSGQKAVKGLLNKEAKQAEKATKKVASGMKKVKNEAEDAGEELEGLAKIFASQEWGNFQDASKNLLKGEVVQAAEDYGNTVRKVANVLGKTRSEMLDLASTVVVGAGKLAEYGISANEALASLEGLVEAGVRNEEQLKRLAPAAALVAAAVQGEVGDIAGSFYQLEDRMGLTSDQIVQVFTNWKKASTETNQNFQEMQETLTNEKFFDQFRLLSVGMTSEVQTNMLTSLGNIQAAFSTNWAESKDFLDKIMEAMTNPAMAAEMGKMTGMAASEVKAMLQTSEGTEEFLQRFLGNMQRMGASGEAALIPMAEAFGVSARSIQELGSRAPQVLASWKKLEEGTLDVAGAMAYSKKLSESGMTFLERWMKKTSRFAAEVSLFGVTLYDVFDALADFPVLEFLAILPGLQVLGSAILPSLIAAFPAAALYANSLGLAAALAGQSLMAMAAAALPWVAAGAAIAATAYLIYTNFEEIKKAGYALYDFLLGTGPLEEGWLGTLQGLLRVLFLPIRLAIISFKEMIDQMRTAYDTLMEFQLVQDVLRETSNYFSNMATDIRVGVETIRDTLTGLLKGLINEQFIDPINRLTSIGWGGVTLGSKLGIQNIPRLAEGAVVTSPTIAQIAEEDSEAVIPLDQYDSLLRRAALASEPGPVERTTTSPNVIVSQDRVVAAVDRLTRTLVDLMRRQDLPTRGSAFAGSSGANPRGF